MQNGTVQRPGQEIALAPLPAEKGQVGTTATPAGRQPAAEADSDEDGPSRPRTMRLPPTRAARRPLRAGAAVRCIRGRLSVSYTLCRLPSLLLVHPHSHQPGCRARVARLVSSCVRRSENEFRRRCVMPQADQSC